MAFSLCLLRSNILVSVIIKVLCRKVHSNISKIQYYLGEASLKNRDFLTISRVRLPSLKTMHRSQRYLQFYFFLGARAPIGIARLSPSLSHLLCDQKVSEYQSLALSCKLFQECIKVCKYASMHVYLPGMVTHHPGDGHPTTQVWSPNKRMYNTDSEFCT